MNTLIDIIFTLILLSLAIGIVGGLLVLTVIGSAILQDIVKTMRRRR